MLTRLLATLAALFLLAACTAVQDDDPTTTVPAVTAATTPGPTTTAPEETVPPTTLPPGTEELPEEIRQVLAELISVTEDVRQLEFIEQPKVVVVTNDELAQRVRDQLEEDLADLPADQALYRLLGLIEDDTDLEALYTDLYSEQVAGYYDGDERELVVPAAEEGFTPLQRATLVHELTHALTDQHYEFHSHFVDLLDSDRYDEASAYQAVIEGDAVLAELLYLQGLSAEEQAEFFGESFDVDSEVFDSAPRFIRDALLFPYDSGFLFVERLYQTGGFEAVGEAYTSPPVSTEQIIDPEVYPDEDVVAVDAPNIEIDGYDLEYQSTWGELGFSLMFDQFLSDGLSSTASSGWGGDTYEVHFDGTEVALVLKYRGDSESDAAEMATALNEYVVTAMDTDEESEREGGTAYTGDDNAWVAVDGSTVLFVAASTSEAFEEVLAGVQPQTTDTTEG